MKVKDLLEKTHVKLAYYDLYEFKEEFGEGIDECYVDISEIEKLYDNDVNKDTIIKLESLAKEKYECGYGLIGDIIIMIAKEAREELRNQRLAHLVFD